LWRCFNQERQSSISREENSIIIYLFSLLIILGPSHFIINSIKTINYKSIKISNYFSFISSPCITAMGTNMNIPSIIVDSANDKDLLISLKRIAPDLIINQCQNILKKDILSILVIGTINRY